MGQFYGRGVRESLRRAIRPLHYENRRDPTIVTAMALEITLLGAPTVRRDGRPVTFDTRKATALLAHLALADRPRPRDSLCELLWPGHDPDRARGALRRTLSTLRGGIGEEWIETAGDAIRLAGADGADPEVDVRRFRDLAREEGSTEELEAAIATFGGEFLEGFGLRDSPEFDDWQIAEAEGLRREMVAVLRRLVVMLAAAGRNEEALPHCRRWIEADPMHEPAHRELIRLYAATGDRAAALGQYRECVRILSRELGVAPLAETVDLYEQVSQGALPADVPPEPAPVGAVGSSTPPVELPLVGRVDDLRALIAAHAKVGEGGRLAVVEGEAGIGKTRLADELARHVEEMGGVVLTARCHDDEGSLSYGVVVELLRDGLRLSDGDGWADGVGPEHLADASLLLPELRRLRADVPEPAPLSGPGGQLRLLEAVASVLGAICDGPRPGVVLIDDAHACDAASLDVITYLGHRLRERRLLLLLSWRTERVPPGHRLRRLSVELSRDERALVVAPSRFDAEEVGELVRAASPEYADHDLERRVFLESEGLPLFVSEYLAAMRDGGGESIPQLPGEVRNVLLTRIETLNAVTRQVLGAAAVVGRSFDLETVREASGRSDEEAVSAIEELTGGGVVRELPGTAALYDFSHDKLRALVYEETSLARRRLLHGRVAAVLDRRRPRGESAALVALHLREAGDADGAAGSYLLAADHAASLHANADAIGHLEVALALGHPDPVGLQERIGDLKLLTGDYAGALDALESAAAQSRPARRAVLEHKLGEVHARRGAWDRAESRFLAALDVAEAGDDALRSSIEADLALTYHRTGRGKEALAAAEEALRNAESSGDLRARAQAHNVLGILARSAGDLDGAASELERSLSLASELGDDHARAAALNNRALVCRDAGEHDRALELTVAALKISAARGDRHRQAALENNLADLHHAAGRRDESMEHLKRAVAIFSEVGADEATRLPEIWKLVSW
jgi:DNA-binding SARP family transcriptional activator/predicted ATPase